MSGARRDPPGAAVRPLRRSRDQRMIAGVAGGIAAHLGVEPAVVRVVAAALALLGGAGVLLYLVAWAALPDADGSPVIARLDPDRGGLGPVVAFVAIAVGGALLLVSGDWPAAHLGAAVFLVLIGLGALSWQRTLSAARPAAVTVAAPDPPSHEPPYPGPPGDAGTTAPIVPPPPPPPPAVPPGPRHRGPSITLITLSAVLVLIGGSALLDALGVLDASPGVVAALALALIGGGLVAGAWLGRAGGLVPIGILLAAALAAIVALDLPARGGIGQRDWDPGTPAEVRSEYRLAIGEGRLDLSGLELDDETIRTRVRQGVGHLIITLPPGATYHVDARTGAGRLEVLGRDEEGDDSQIVATTPPRAGAPRIEVEARLGAGKLEVR